jgi:hypothetical protein
LKQARLLVFLFLAVFSFSLLHGQTTTTGAVNGVISDPSGAVVPGASVTLTSVATGAVQTAKSNNGGAYRFDLVPPGVYTLVVDLSGFQKSESKLQVADSQVLAADIKLVIGSELQTVTVEATGTILEAENGNVATNVSQIQVEEVPNSGNNLLDVNNLTPGMNTNFGVVGNTFYTIDGENFNDPYNNGNNSGASNLTLGLNDVQEATVTGNGYSGQFGGLVGASVSFVTKSGGNRLHGNASWFWTGRSLVANSYVHKATPPITPRSFENANQWSALISGPVVIPHVFNGHDKLFFLVDSEGLRAILPASPVTVGIPSPALENYIINTALPRNGLSASIPYYQQMFAVYNAAAVAHNAQPGNPTFSNTAAFLNASATGCPTTANALSSTDLTGLGFTASNAGAYTGPAGACGLSYASNATTYANEALEILRVDAVLGSSDKGFIRYEHDAGVQPTAIDPVSAAFNAISTQPQHNGQLNETHTFGARGVNNFILGGLWYGAIFGPANLPVSLAVFPAQLSLSDGSLTTLGGSNASWPEGRNITTIQLQDDVALNFGAHTLKFGGKGYIIKENDFYLTNGTVPLETVSTLGAFINGGYDPATAKITGTGPSAVTTYTNATTFAQTFPQRPNYPVLINQQAYYVEDDWKASRTLSLTASLRLEHQGNIQCLKNCITLPATQFPDLNHSASIPYNQAYKFNQSNVLPGLQKLEWQPRFGFAYNPPFLRESFVVRGGYGIFYDGLASSVLEGVVKNPPTKNSFSVSQDHLANSEISNLWNDTTVYNSAFTNGIVNGGTVASIKASLPTAAEQNSFSPPSVYAPQNNFKMYNVQKWNLEIQKSFGPNTAISINYLGNHGTHKPYTNAGLNAYQSPNASVQIAGLPTTQPDTRFGNVYYYVSGGSNNYNGVITTFTRRFGASGVFTAGYTYGKILDTGANGFSTTTATTYTTASATDIGSPPDPYHPNRTYGPAATDERHNLTLNYVYRVPFRNIFYGGWEVSGAAFAYSGLPFTVMDTATTNKINAYSTGAYGGSLVASYLGGGEGTCGYGKQQCLKASQFSSATSVDSNGPRNAWRGPMYVSTDLALTKNIPLYWEGGTFSVAAQAFNVLNHLNFNRPTGSLNSSSFGQITTTVNPSGVFSGVGGDDSPRIVQLKAKVVF